jgi:hypothetical protein
VDSVVSFPEGWTAPPELMGPVPRKTRLSADGVASATVMTGLLLLALAGTVWACIAMARYWTRTAALRDEGSEIVGEIKRLWSSGRGSTHMVSYEFTANNVAFTGQSSVPTDRRHELRVGDPLRIRFVPANPATNRPADWEESALDSSLTFLIPIVPGVFGVVLLSQLRWQRRLVAEGLPAAAVVTRCYRGSRGSRWIDYQFRAEDGRVGEGTDNVRLEVGTAICVLYLPRNPRRNQRYVGSCYRVVQ